MMVMQGQLSRENNTGRASAAEHHAISNSQHDTGHKPGQGTYLRKVCEMLSIMLPTSEVLGRSFTCSCSTFSSSITCQWMIRKKGCVVR